MKYLALTLIALLTLLWELPLVIAQVPTACVDFNPPRGYPYPIFEQILSGIPSYVDWDHMSWTPTVIEVSDAKGDFAYGQQVSQGWFAGAAFNNLFFRQQPLTIAPNPGATYYMRFRELETGYTQIFMGPFAVSEQPTPYYVIGEPTYCPFDSPVTLTGSQPGVSYQLMLNYDRPVGKPVAGTGAGIDFGHQKVEGNYFVKAIGSCGERYMSGYVQVRFPTIKLVTAQGQSYPSGVSSLTIGQNRGNVLLNVSGCPSQYLAWPGGSATTLAVETNRPGTQTFTATCFEAGGCTSLATFSLTVLPAALSVRHHDADYGNSGNHIIKPYLELVNTGEQAIPYADITVRYWLTSEGQAPPTNLAVYYAQPGAVNMKYVPLSQPRQGATGYVEYSFRGGGSLNSGSNSGPIENGIQKTDGSNFNESDDYSYQANYQDYIPNSRITAYRNGADGVPVIVWGQEPTVVSSQTAVQVYSAAKDGPTTSQIQTRLELRNTGNVALPVAGFRLRYYFSSDNNQLASVYIDYADIGAQNVAARVIKLPAPVGGADSYVEMSFPNSPMQVNALGSLGIIDFRIVRSDYGLFEQSNDYSYAANYGNVGLNNRVTVLLNNRLIFGTPPSGAPARVMAAEPVSALAVRVLDNPVVSAQAQVEISGAEGQAVNLHLVDMQGRLVHEQRIEQAGGVEPVSVPLGQSRGTLVLKVGTTSQQQSLKLLRP